MSQSIAKNVRSTDGGKSAKYGATSSGMIASDRTIMGRSVARSTASNASARRLMSIGPPVARSLAIRSIAAEDNPNIARDQRRAPTKAELCAAGQTIYDHDPMDYFICACPW